MHIAVGGRIRPIDHKGTIGYIAVLAVMEHLTIVAVERYHLHGILHLHTTNHLAIAKVFVIEYGVARH